MVPRLLKGIMIDLDMKIPDMPDEAALEELAGSVNAERMGNHPVKMTHDEIREAYRKALTPMCEAEKQACLDIWRYYGSGQ